MKKLLYIMAIAFASSLALTACSDDEVSPVKPNNGGGAGSLDPLWSNALESESQVNLKQPKPLSIMKKLIYIIVIAFVSSMTFTSCADDDVTPVKPNNGGGAGSLDPL